MNASHPTLTNVSELVLAELTGYLPKDFAIAEVTSEILPGPDGETYIRTTVIFEDEHPELDPRVLNRFSSHMVSLCQAQGFDRPTIAYANRSEIPA